MVFKLSDDELAVFLDALRAKLMSKSWKRRGSTEGAEGPRHTVEDRILEDAVCQVLLEVTAFLRGATPLRSVRGFDMAIATLPQLAAYSGRRLATVAGNIRRAATRDAAQRNRLRDDVVRMTMAAPPPVEHPIYDRDLLLKVLTRSRPDPLLHRFVVLILSSHLNPEVEDLDPCNNTRLGEILGVPPHKIRSARYRLMTLVETILSERDDEGPEEPA